MIELRIENRLLLTSLQLQHKGFKLDLKRTLIDTGSTGTIVSADQAATIGIVPEEQDVIYRISGVGGAEFVYAKVIDSLAIGSCTSEPS